MSLFWCAFVLGLSLFVIVGLKLNKTLRYVPNSMVLLIKVVTGLLLIINEVPTALGLKNTTGKPVYTVLG